ncbi:hypothetical protein CPC08DRAFT_764605 [Agrocybe pediades]|nr:hypothetical protein CPC08DRAFT_764605 [Agrocybe pediades]
MNLSEGRRDEQSQKSYKKYRDYYATLSAARGFDEFENAPKLLGFLMYRKEFIGLNELDRILDLEPGTSSTLANQLGPIIRWQEGGGGVRLPTLLRRYLGNEELSDDFYIQPVPTLIEHLENCLSFICSEYFICTSRFARLAYQREIAGCRPSAPLDVSSLHAAMLFFSDNEWLLKPNQQDSRHKDSVQRTMQDFSILTYCGPASNAGQLYQILHQKFVPSWLRYLKRSDLKRSFIRHRVRLDTDYRTLLVQYYNDYRLSLGLAIVVNFSKKSDTSLSSGGMVTLSDEGLDEVWALTTLTVSEDPLAVWYPVYPSRINPEMKLKTHQNELALYLRDSQRSGTFGLDNTSEILHANAVLACLEILEKFTVVGTHQEDDHHDQLSWESYWEQVQKPTGNEKATNEARRLLVIGYMLHFFPQAGRSEKLFQICSAQRCPQILSSYSSLKSLVIKAMKECTKRHGNVHHLRSGRR